MLSKPQEDLNLQNIYKPYPSLGDVFLHFNPSAPKLIIDELKKYTIHKFSETKKGQQYQTMFNRPGQDTLVLTPKSREIKEEMPSILKNNSYWINSPDNPSLLSLYSLKEFCINSRVAKDNRIINLQLFLHRNLFPSNVKAIIFEKSFESSSSSSSASTPSSSNQLSNSPNFILGSENKFENEALFIAQSPSVPINIKKHLFFDCLNCLSPYGDDITSAAVQIIETMDTSSWPLATIFEEKFSTSITKHLGEMFCSYFYNLDEFGQDKDKKSMSGQAKKYIYDYYEDNKNFSHINNAIGLQSKIDNHSRPEYVEEIFSNLFSSVASSPNILSKTANIIKLIVTIIPTTSLILANRSIKKRFQKNKENFLLTSLNLTASHGASNFEKIINNTLLDNLELFSPTYQEKILNCAQDFINSDLAKKAIIDGLVVRSDILAKIEKHSLSQTIYIKNNSLISPIEKKHSKI